MVGKKIYKRLVQYLQAREAALGEPAVASPTAATGPPAPVVVGATRNGAREAATAGSAPVPVRLPHPAAQARAALTHADGRPASGRSVGERVVLGQRLGRALTQDVFELGLGHAPRCVLVVGLGAALRDNACCAVATERFRLRASSKRRCRPFFTSDSSVGAGA